MGHLSEFICTQIGALFTVAAILKSLNIFAMAERSGRKGIHPSSSSGRSHHLSDPLEGPSAQPPPSKRAQNKKASAAPAIASSSREEQRFPGLLHKPSLLPHCLPRNPLLYQGPLTGRMTASPDHPPSAGPAPPPGKEPLFQTVSEAPTPQSTSPAPAFADPPSQAAPLQLPQAFKILLSRAIREGFAQCLQQVGLPAGTPIPAQPSQHRELEDIASDHEPEDYDYSGEQASTSEPDEAPESALSDDEGLLPDQSPFIGLFRPQMFRSLLFKAIAFQSNRYHLLGGGPISCHVFSRPGSCDGLICGTNYSSGNHSST